MLYDWKATADLGIVRDLQAETPVALAGEGLWVCLVSSGSCAAALADTAGALPPQTAQAGALILSRAPLNLTPQGSCHLLCVQLTGLAPAQFLSGLAGLPFLARGEACPAAAGLVGQLGQGSLALSTSQGWVVIVLFPSTVFALELKGLGSRLPTRDEA